MQIATHSLFTDCYTATADVPPVADGTPDSVYEVQVLMARDLESEVSERRNIGYEVVGTCEFVAKGFLGVRGEAKIQADQVGATVVLFELWPAKLRAVRRMEDGSIDLASVLADPPAGLSPKGHYVLRAAFMRPNISLQRTADGVR